MTVLNDMQFELLPSLSAIDGQTFGIGLDVSVDEEGFAPGDDDWTDQDSDNPVRGNKAFGRDTLNGPSWVWSLHVNREDTEGALETLGLFRTAWRALHIRSTPGAVIPLRYCLEGRYRRIFGRPRRFSAPPNNLILSGYVPITCDFQAVDAFTYDDIESSVMLHMTTSGHSDGGFILPATFPITTLPVGSYSQQAVVGGDAPTYPTIRFNGPVTNPKLTADNWEISLAMSIPAGAYVIVDTRPWVLSAMLNGNANVGGKLGRRQYLNEVILEPGRNSLTFTGASGGSTSATCEVRWSNAHNSI